jgi:hypothetical protein
MVNNTKKIIILRKNIPLHAIKYPQHKVNIIFIGKETTKINIVFMYPLRSKGCLKAISNAPTVNPRGYSKNPGDCNKVVLSVNDATST